MKRLLLFTIILFTITQLQAQGWGQTQKIVPDDRALGDEFGWSVAMQGDIAAIGARFENGADYGAVYIFAKDASGNWVQTQKLVNSDVRQFDRFGQSIDIDGNFMIVGARGQDYDENNANFENGAGAAYIFEKDGTGNWNEVQKLVASDRGQTFQAVFGETVAISGNYAVVNKPTESSELNINAGVCYIFERDTNGIWNEVQKIINSHRNNDDRFGDFSISISGNIIAIGARQQDYDASGQNELPSAGAVYIFERDTNGTWSEIQKIVASDREQDERFGRSVALEGDLLMVGASQEYLQGDLSTQYGAVYVFERDTNGVFNEVQKIRPNASNHQSNFGHALDMDGNRLVVGAYFMNTQSVGAADAAFVFEKDGTGTWNQTAIMYDVEASTQDRFGQAVAISDDFAIVGAHQEDEDEMGLNFISQAGSAYVFNVNEPNTIPTLSIVENNFGLEFKAYPNPNQGNFTINLGKIYNQIRVSITNSLGQEIQTQKIQSSDNVTLNIDAKSGMYFVNISTEKGTSAVLKILKI